jgi:predicted ribosomally synthesized peptide with SipW-like signal peptide
MKKKIIAVAALIVILMSIMVSGTLAYFTSTGTYESTISTGNVEIAFSDGDNAARSLTKSYIVMPGSTAENEVYVYNIGPNSVWIRVSVDANMVVNGQEQELDPELVTLDYAEGWEKMGDYWYYTSALGGNKADSPAEHTPSIFTVAFSEKMGNEYQGSTLQIKINAEAVQYRNNGSVYTEAQGWPGEVYDEEVQG